MANPRSVPSMRLLLWLAYPALIFFGLRWMEPRAVAALLAAALLLRHLGQARQWLCTTTRLERAVLATLLGWSALTMLTNHETLLRLYPVVMGLGVLVVFSWSLYAPPTAIERIARLGTPDLPPSAVAWTRRVTGVWCVFLAGNCAFAAWTAFYASRDTWSLYNGFIVYLLMGLLFGGEWLLRQRHLKNS